MSNKLKHCECGSQVVYDEDGGFIVCHGCRFEWSIKDLWNYSAPVPNQPVKMIGATCVCGREMTVTNNVVNDQPVELSPETVTQVATAIYDEDHNEHCTGDWNTETNVMKGLYINMANAAIRRMPGMLWKGWSADTPSNKADEYAAVVEQHTKRESVDEFKNSEKMNASDDHVQSLNTWQPIETAPKDMTWILLYGYGNGTHTHTVGAWNSDRDIWQVDKCGNVYMPDPTHWMPLPKPPTTEIEGDN